MRRAAVPALTVLIALAVVGFWGAENHSRAAGSVRIIVPGVAADSASRTATPPPEAAAWVDFFAVYTLVADSGGTITSSVSGRAPVLTGEFRQLTGTVNVGTPVAQISHCTASSTTDGTAPLKTFQLILSDPRNLGTAELILEPPTHRFTIHVACSPPPPVSQFQQDTFAYWYTAHGGEINGAGGYRLKGFTAPGPESPHCAVARKFEKQIVLADFGHVEEQLSIVVVDTADCPVLHPIDLD